MEIHTKTKTVNNINIPEQFLKLYPHDACLYENRPEGELNLIEIEKLTEERLEVLMIIKGANDKGFAYTSDEWKKYILEMLTNGNHVDYVRLLYHPDFKLTNEDIRRRRKDVLSHYILVLAFCQEEEKRSWFTQLEVDMFRLKFLHLTDTGIKEFIKINGIGLTIISKDDKNKYREDLLNCTPRLNASNFDSTDFYKVPFKSAPELLHDLSCFVRRGFIYVPHFDAIRILENVFKEHLTSRLLYFSEALKLYCDSRLAPIIKRMSNSSSKITEYNPVVNAGSVSLTSLDSLSQTSFPLCTRNLYEALQRFHHLKYNGRQLLQLFLKGIGLSVQDALEFFRSEFTKVIDSNKFDKEYTYSIRHNYGLEGSKIDYNPPSCINVMNTSPPNQGEYHGCPFRLWDAPMLKKRLAGLGISNQGVIEITDLAKAGHAQIACSKFFEYTHGGTQAAINHPNQFFEESRKYYLSKEQQSQPGPSK